MSTDPTDGSEVGERRRAIQAERERRAQRDSHDEPPPSPSTSLVRPYARIASPTGPLRMPAAGEDPAVEPEETDLVQEDVEEDVDEDLDERVDEDVDEPLGDRNGGQDVEVRVGAPDIPVGPEAASSPAPWPEPVERLRPASASLWPSGSSPAPPQADAPQPLTPETFVPEPPAAELEPPAAELEPPSAELEPPAAELEPPATEPEPPAAEPDRWSFPSPVVAPEPPAYEDLEPVPSAGPPKPPESPGVPEWPELPTDDVPHSEPAPPLGLARHAGVDEWSQLSLRVGDDDAWLRALRESLVSPGGAADDLGPDPDELVLPEPEPVGPQARDDSAADVRAIEDVRDETVRDETVRDEAVRDEAVRDEAVREPVVPDEAVVQDETRDDDAHRDGWIAREVPREEVVPDEPAAVDHPAPVTPYPPFRRPPAERLTRALTDDPAAATAGRSADAADEGPAVRGTLEPVLRRSTERAKVVPVIRPPVLPPEPGDDQPAAVRGAAPASWDEAMARNVVPRGVRRGRRSARARHESGGAEEYRPRAGADRSLTLVVLGMLLVLAVLVGIAVWAFWPRAVGGRGLPPFTITEQSADRST